MTIEPLSLISSLLDNSMTRDQLLELLDAVESSAELRDRVSNYQFINDTTAGHRVLDNGYSKRIIERLQAEPGWKSRLHQ